MGKGENAGHRCGRVENIVGKGESAGHCFGRIENFVEKGENAGDQHFLLFPSCFQKSSFSGLFKLEIML